MVRYLLFLLLVLTSVFIYGCGERQVNTTTNTPKLLQGTARVDSLQRVLAGAQDDTGKVMVLGHLAYEYRVIDPETGIRYANDAMDLAEKLAWKHGTALANYNMGLNYKYKANYPEALEHFFKALKINEELGLKVGVGSCLSNIGVVYQDRGDYEKALEFFLKSLKINEDLKNQVNLAGDLGNIGIIYNVYKQDYQKALEFDLRSLKIFDSLGDKDGVAHNLGNIGAVYQELHNYEKAIDYDLRALQMFQVLGDKNSMAINMGNIGETYLSMAKSQHARDNIQSIATSASLRSAITYLTNSITLSEEIGDLQNILEFSKHLSEAYEFSGNYDMALASYKKYATIKDSVYSTDNKFKIASLETQRALEVKDKQLQLNKLDAAKRRNERILLIIVTILLLVIIGIGLRKYTQQRRSNRQLAREKKKHLARIEEQTSVLSEIAYTQSHEVSGQVATILGLVDVFNFNDTTDPDNNVVIHGIAEVSHKLDKIVKEMIVKENNLNRPDGQ